MGKRSDFDKIDKDKYFTPAKGVDPLLWVIPSRSTFAEPCAGDGRLIRHMEAAGHQCLMRGDIAPDCPTIPKRDALALCEADLVGVDYIVTNPPWNRPDLHKIIDHCRKLRPTWLLFDADWMFTSQERMAAKHGVPTAPELLKYCETVVAVGRLKWIEGSKHSGKENCAWYKFGDRLVETKVIPIGGLK